MDWSFFLAAFSLLLLLACAIVPIIAPLPTQAAPVAPVRQQTGAVTESQLLLLYPELRQAPAPAWLRPGVRLTYNSAFATFARDIDDPIPSGAALIQVDVVAQAGGATGVAQILGGMWLPPEALGALKAGAVLDRDPLTGLVTRVDEAGNRQIVLSGEGPGYLIRYTYDARNGRLIGFYTEAHMLAGVQYMELAEE